jgi:hypothetical protein
MGWLGGALASGAVSQSRCDDQAPSLWNPGLHHDAPFERVAHATRFFRARGCPARRVSRLETRSKSFSQRTAMSVRASARKDRIERPVALRRARAPKIRLQKSTSLSTFSPPRARTLARSRRSTSCARHGVRRARPAHRSRDANDVTGAEDALSAHHARRHPHRFHGRVLWANGLTSIAAAGPVSPVANSVALWHARRLAPLGRCARGSSPSARLARRSRSTSPESWKHL